MGSMVQFVIFAVLTGGLIAGVHIYLYRRLFADTSENRMWRRVGMGAMSVLGTLLVLSFSVTRFVPMDFTFLVATLVWMWMGTSLYLLFALWLFGGVRGVARLFARMKAASVSTVQGTVRVDGAEALGTAAVLAVSPGDVVATAPAPEVNVERRRFLARVSAGGAALAAGGLSGYGMWNAFHPPVVNEVAVRLPGLPRELDGYTIVHLSDIHVGPIIQRRFMDELVARCNALHPDLVAITGDLVDGNVPTLGPSVAALRELRTRDGTYFVTGNHEYYWNATKWADALEGMGVQALRNRHVRIGDSAASFDLVGVDDWMARNMGPGLGYDLEAAVVGRQPDRAAVLLAHQPANWRVAAHAGMGLQLSGHTHGGQFFPFTLVVSAMWEHKAGHYEENGKHLYVSQGTGFWGPPLRVGTGPEIVKVTLLA
ncbi:metallophosphoesterase [Myxococcus landrumensis]|uniref:Metallophosphoesterase n=1 Tax=Myxococcus landrumensis TaxID=2813577 RepID=A0ABX7MY39_9BACT|nr:metallophosphoesterase [Myxococcus landrumus]QSQ11109.1 metallophosphoesterase [Myxococcus landrumus]